MDAPATPPPVPDPAPDGRYMGWLAAVKGLTITNALVIILLVVFIFPTYVVYRAINDEKLLDRFLSTYREIASQNVGCTQRIAKARGGPEVWSISTGFAYSGSDRWTVSVHLTHEPTPDQLQSYCATLDLIVDFMRDPDASSPSFPNSDEPIVRQYRRERDEG